MSVCTQVFFGDVSDGLVIFNQNSAEFIHEVVPSYVVATKLGVLSGGSGGHGKKGGDVLSETAKNVLGGNRFSVCDGERY